MFFLPQAPASYCHEQACRCIPDEQGEVGDQRVTLLVKTALTGRLPLAGRSRAGSSEQGSQGKRESASHRSVISFSSPRLWSSGGGSDPDRSARRRNRWTAGGEAKRWRVDCSRPGLGPFLRDATQRIGVCHRRLYRAIIRHCAPVGPPRGL